MNALFFVVVFFLIPRPECVQEKEGGRVPAEKLEAKSHSQMSRVNMLLSIPLLPLSSSFPLIYRGSPFVLILDLMNAFGYP